MEFKRSIDSRRLIIWKSLFHHLFLKHAKMAIKDNITLFPHRFGARYLAPPFKSGLLTAVSAWINFCVITSRAPIWKGFGAKGVGARSRLGAQRYLRIMFNQSVIFRSNVGRGNVDGSICILWSMKHGVGHREIFRLANSQWHCYFEHRLAVPRRCCHMQAPITRLKKSFPIEFWRERGPTASLSARPDSHPWRRSTIQACVSLKCETTIVSKIDVIQIMEFEYKSSAHRRKEKENTTSNGNAERCILRCNWREPGIDGNVQRSLRQRNSQECSAQGNVQRSNR